MKKKLSVLFAVIVVLAMLAVPAFSASATISVPYMADSEITVDGKNGENYTRNGGKLYGSGAPFTVLDGVELDGVTYEKNDNLFNLNGGSFFFGNSDYLYVFLNLTKVTDITENSYVRINVNRTDDPANVTTVKVGLSDGTVEFSANEYFFEASAAVVTKTNTASTTNPNGTAQIEIKLKASPEHRFHAGEMFGYELYIVNASADDNVEAFKQGDVTDLRFEVAVPTENDVADLDLTDCGNGTAEEPYLISNVEQLDFFRDCINYNLKGAASANYRLTDDIDYSGNLWTAIGSTAVPFNGTFDGDGHSVSNLMQRRMQDKVYNGFFANVGANGTVKNLKIEHFRIAVQKYDGAIGMVGGIAGMSKGTISSCSVDDVNFNVTGAGHYIAVGGIVGWGDGTISKCYFTNTFTTDNGDDTTTNNINFIRSDNVIALAGICADPAAKIENCATRNSTFTYVNLAEDGQVGYIGANENNSDCTIVKSAYSNCKINDGNTASGSIPPETQPVTNPPETTPAPETTAPGGDNDNPGTSDMFVVIAVFGALAAAAAIVISRKKQYNR